MREGATGKTGFGGALWRGHNANNDEEKMQDDNRGGASSTASCTPPQTSHNDKWIAAILVLYFDLEFGQSCDFCSLFFFLSVFFVCALILLLFCTLLRD